MARKETSFRKISKKKTEVATIGIPKVFLYLKIEENFLNFHLSFHLVYRLSFLNLVIVFLNTFAIFLFCFSFFKTKQDTNVLFILEKNNNFLFREYKKNLLKASLDFILFFTPTK